MLKDCKTENGLWLDEHKFPYLSKQDRSLTLTQQVWAFMDTSLAHEEQENPNIDLWDTYTIKPYSTLMCECSFVPQKANVTTCIVKSGVKIHLCDILYPDVCGGNTYCRYLS